MKHAINIIVASILAGGIGYLSGLVFTAFTVGAYLDEYDNITDPDVAMACHLARRAFD